MLFSQSMNFDKDSNLSECRLWKGLRYWLCFLNMLQTDYKKEFKKKEGSILYVDFGEDVSFL